MIKNDFIGPFCKVWMERYVNTEECMTTWIPREIMEDVSWLMGEGTTEVFVN